MVYLHFTSGMPEPAAIAAPNVTNDAATNTNIKLIPENLSKDEETQSL